MFPHRHYTEREKEKERAEGRRSDDADVASHYIRGQQPHTTHPLHTLHTHRHDQAQQLLPLQLVLTCADVTHKKEEEHNNLRPPSLHGECDAHGPTTRRVTVLHGAPVLLTTRPHCHADCSQPQWTPLQADLLFWQRRRAWSVHARTHSSKQHTKIRGEGRVMWDNDSRNAPSPLLSTPSWTHSPGSVFAIKGNTKVSMYTRVLFFFGGWVKNFI